MQNQSLPPNKLTVSEKSLIWLSRWLVLDAAIFAFAVFLHFPLVVGLIAVGYWWRQVKKRRYQPGPTTGIHGTGRFGSAGDALAAGLIGRVEGFIVGTLPCPEGGAARPGLLAIVRIPVWDIARVRRVLQRYTRSEGKPGSGAVGSQLVRLPTSDQISHSAFYIPTGGGKTWGIVIPNLTSLDENAVVYDPSGDAFRHTAEFRRREFGHRIYVIDPFGITGAENVDRLNPLDLVTAADPGRLDFCLHLAFALVVEKLGMNRDQFWHSATVACTVFLLMVITLEEAGPHRNLCSIGELLVPKRLHGIAKEYASHNDPVVRKRAEQMLNIQSKTLDSLMACMTAEHNWQDSPAYSSVLAESTFSPRSLLQEKATVYIAIPGNRAVESQPFLRTLLTAFLYPAFEAGPDIHRPTVRFYLDEVATIGKLDLLMTLYTQGRKYGLRSCNFFQSVGQVADIVGGPEKIQVFRSNMAAEVWKPRDFQSAKEISDWIGQTTVSTVSTSLQSGTNAGWSNQHGCHPSEGKSGGSSENSSRTVSETGVLVIRPEEVLQLGPREAILTMAGTPALKVDIIRATEALDCGKPETVEGNDELYLSKVRCRVVPLLLAVVWGFGLSLALVTSGIREWSRPSATTRQTAAQQQQMVTGRGAPQRKAAGGSRGGQPSAPRQQRMP